MVCVVPDVRAVAMATVAFEPAGTETVTGDSERLKSLGTTAVARAECVQLVPVPDNENGKLPPALSAAAVMVTVAASPLMTEAGETCAVRAAGNPVAAKPIVFAGPAAVAGGTRKVSAWAERTVCRAGGVG